MSTVTTTPGRSLSLAIPCDLAAVREAARQLRSFLEQQGLNGPDLDAWELITSEAGNNAVEHTPPAALDRPIELALRVTPSDAELVVVDHTPGFDLPDNPQLPDDPLHLFGNPASGLAHPLYVNTELVGVVSVGRFTRQHPFTAGQVNIIHTFADFLGIQLRNARIQEEHLRTRLVTRELEIAATIQRSLLPVRLPEPDGFRLAGFCESASKVGGDYFDAVQVPNAGLLLVIADVMGKGVPAAMFAAIFRSHVHARPDLAIRPGEFLTWLNRALYPDLDRVEMFVTAQVVFLDQTTRTLRIASAGHCPLLVRDAIGEISEINADGPPLGIDADLEFGEHSLSVEAGMRFLMYTDGLIEARNPAGDLLGLDRLKSWFGSRDLDFASVAQIESGLVHLARDFQGSAPAADDLTFVVMADDPTAGLTKDGSSGNLHVVY